MPLTIESLIAVIMPLNISSRSGFSNGIFVSAMKACSATLRPNSVIYALDLTSKDVCMEQPFGCLA